MEGGRERGRDGGRREGERKERGREGGRVEVSVVIHIMTMHNYVVDTCWFPFHSTHTWDGPGD